MTAQIACPSCQTKLAIPTEIGPTAKIKCPKCGQVIPIPSKKILVPEPELASVVEERPPLSRGSPTENPILPYLVPACSIFVALFSMALPILLGQYVLGLIVACLAALGSVAGFVFLMLKKTKGVEIHVAGSVICVAAILLAINMLMLKGSIEANETLHAKNEQLATTTKADLAEAKKKFAEAEDAPRKAEEILKKAAEAPQQAEAFYKSAKAAQDKTDAAEKRTADLLAKVEELEKKNDQDRKNIAEENVKVELSQKTLKALQKNLDQTQKEVEDKRQDLVTLKKEIDADKKRAEEKQKEATDLLKKVEEALKGASLKLKDKNPAVRIATAKSLGKLPTSPEARETVSEALVEMMLDAGPEVRNAASEALAKHAPSIQPHVLTLLIGKDKRAAARQLQGIGKEAKFALPVLIHCYRSNATGDGLTPDQLPQIRAIWLDSLAGIAPDDKRVVQIILDEVVNKQDRFQTSGGSLVFAREKAISLLDVVKADKSAKVKALVTVLDAHPQLVVTAIIAIERIGLPEAAEAIPALKKLKLSPDDDVRKAATKALTTLEKSK